MSYQAIVVDDGPLDFGVRNIAEKGQEVDDRISLFESVLASMKTGDSKAAIQTVIQAFREEQRLAERLDRAMGRFHRNFDDVPF